MSTSSAIGTLGAHGGVAQYSVAQLIHDGSPVVMVGRIGTSSINSLISSLSHARAKRALDLPPSEPCGQVVSSDGEIRVCPGNLCLYVDDEKGIQPHVHAHPWRERLQKLI